MTSLAWIGLLLTFAIDAPKTHQIELNGHVFTLPVGFTIEHIAGPPLVDRPIVADFDEQGRLYVADSSGSNDKVDVQLKQKPHRIVRLEDTDGDGRFDKRTVFANQMMFPEGCMWYAGSLYVAAPPSIWKLTDTDGDGVADQRVEWFQGKTLTGCANDLHGPYLGPDGWIYWCKGAFAKQTYERPGKPPFVTRAAHIFRARPDGTGIETVMTGGMDNPVDVVFTPGGERIFTTTFFQHPGGGKRDGLVHAVYGGIYGKIHNPIFEHPWTGPDVLPVLTHMGPAAPCGLVRYESAVFGAGYQDNLFACQFNLHKVSRHVLIPKGATFTTRDEDFLVSSNLDFHPTDVQEDADGSLLVVDTGGWYKLCCPTSQFPRPEVFGAIYRVRRKDAARVEDPRGLKLAWDKMTAKELAGLLGDSRPAVRLRAIQSLGFRSTDAIPALTDALKSQISTSTRLGAVWALTRINHDEARRAVRQALSDNSETVRQAALHSVSLHRDPQALSELRRLVLSSSERSTPQNRRAAAEAMGRIKEPSAIAELTTVLGGWLQPSDRFLEHSVIYALIEIGDTESLRRWSEGSWSGRREAMIALDQIDRTQLRPEIVARELRSSNAIMRETAWWIIGRHPEWGDRLAKPLRELLLAKDRTPEKRQDILRQMGRFASSPIIQTLLAERLRYATYSLEERRAVLQTIARAGLKETPKIWIEALTEILSADEPDLLAEAVITARALPTPKQQSPELKRALRALAVSAKLDVGIRLGALAAIPGGAIDLDSGLISAVCSQLHSDKPVANRSVAADVLSRAKLTPDQLVTLTESFKTIGPMEVDRLLEPFAQSTDEKVGLKLIGVLTDAPIRSSLRVDQLKPRLAKYPASVHKQAEELYAAIDVDAAKQRSKLEELFTSFKDGDVRRGQAVFHSTKAACITCHALGYVGGKFGPDLTHIGKIRTERDLLEAIVFPNASFVRSYEPVAVTTRDGKVHNGLIRKDVPDEIVLATAADQEVRIARSDVEELLPSKVSVMPAGLDQQLTPRELADLVAFLKACK